MAGPEGALLIPQRFEPEAYRNLDIPPVLVTRTTHTLLEFYQNGQMRDHEKARAFFLRETVPYLKAAEVGSRVIFRPGRVCFERQELETAEAADHAQAVFSALPEYLTSDFMPEGYSRTGTLRPPQTRGEYVFRIRELRAGIRQVGEREMDPEMHLDGNPILLRTFGFFKVASELPFKSKTDEAKTNPISEARFNALLGEVQF